MDKNTEILQNMRQDLLNHFAKDDERFESVGKRIGAVEKKVYWFSGVGAAAMFIISKISGKI